MTRVALAAASSRTATGFPESLAEIAPRFSGSVPTSPYDGSEVVYQRLNDGKDFSVTIPAVKSFDLELPQIEFSSVVQ